MDRTEEAVRRLLEARGTEYTEDQLRRLLFKCDPNTTIALHDLLIGKRMERVLCEWSERQLSPAARDAMVILDELGFVSSYEVMERYKIKPSTASNRLSELARSGVAEKAFSFAPPGGGRRYYFARTGKKITPQAIQEFAESLGGGAVIAHGNGTKAISR